MVGGEKDKVGEEEGGDHVVEVPMRIQLQVGHGGLVDEGGEGKLLLVNVGVKVMVVDPFSSEEVDKELLARAQATNPHLEFFGQ